MLVHSYKSKENGFTLIELMIAILLAVIVIGATMAFVFTSVKSSTENIRMTRMNQEMRAVMGFMLDELKRAGYTSDAEESGMMDVLAWDAVDNCLTYAYMTDSATPLPADNTMAFRLDNDGVLRFIDAGGNCATVDPNSVHPLNDVEVVRITNFFPSNFVSGAVNPLTFATSASVAVPSMLLTIQGEINNPTVTKTMSDYVRLRNEDPDF